MESLPVLVEPSLMSDYFVVLDPVLPEASFVAGFGEQSLAVSFAASERESGRVLVVIDGGTGEQIYPPAADAPGRLKRHSGMQLVHRTPGEPGDEDPSLD